MSWRARAYMAVLVLRHLGIGLCCLLAPNLFTSPAYAPLQQLASLHTWGIILTSLGIAAAVAARLGEPPARIVLVASSAVSGCWAAAFTVAAVRGDTGPTAPIVWSALLCKDLIVSAMPLRTPLEDAVRRAQLPPP